MKITGIQEIKDELARVQGWERKARDRMTEQAKAGDTEGAALSRKAYEYAKAYAIRLKNILDGYKNAGGKKYFTKDAGHRYRYKNGTPQG